MGEVKRDSYATSRIHVQELRDAPSCSRHTHRATLGSLIRHSVAQDSNLIYRRDSDRSMHRIESRLIHFATGIAVVDVASVLASFHRRRVFTRRPDANAANVADHFRQIPGHLLLGDGLDDKSSV